MVFERVDGGDAQQVVDETPGAGPARLHPNAHVADEVDDIGDGEEIRLEPEPADRGELIIETVPHPAQAGAVGVRVPVGDRGLAALPQYSHRISPGQTDCLQFGYFRLSPSQIRIRVETAPVGDLFRVGEQVDGVIAAQSRVLADAVRQIVHDRGGLQPRLGGLRLERAERQEERCGVEDVAGDRVVRAEEPDHVGEHGRHALGAGKLEHVCGVPQARSRAGAGVVADDLDGDTAGQPPRPRLEQGSSVRTVAVEDGAADIGARAKEHRGGGTGLAEQERGCLVGGDPGATVGGAVEGALTATRRVRGRDEPDQARPTGALVVAVCEDSDRREMAVVVAGLEVRADDRVDPGGEARADVADRPVYAVMIGDRRHINPGVDGCSDEHLGVGGAVVSGERRGDMEVGEGGHGRY